MKFTLKLSFLLIFSVSGAYAQGLQTLYAFTNFNGGPFYAPAIPISALTIGGDGNLYGTTYGNIYDLSYAYNPGEVFQINTNGSLNQFPFPYAGYNGANSEVALTSGNDGNLYGATSDGGNGFGNIFEITTNGVLTALYSFSGSSAAYPEAALIFGADGNLYGTTHGGGNYGTTTTGTNYGTIFKVTTNGVLTNFFTFAGTNGANPEAALTFGDDGNLYGTTYGGGSSGGGTIFEATTNGILKVLDSFGGTNGVNPYSGLTLGNDGNFYGTTSAGSVSNAGTIFRVTTNGALTVLVSFVVTNGANPYAGLILGSDGNFYGTTSGGGQYNEGTLFQVTTNDALTTVFSFNGNDGAGPEAALTPGNDGNSLYGTTAGGGADGYGTVFRLSFPCIAVQPQSQTNSLGAPTTFSVDAISLAPLTYQWLKNGIGLTNGGNICGANTSMLVVSNISDADAADYSVVVSNQFNSVTSSNAILTASDLPTIAVQPLSQTISVGSNVTFLAQAYGALPMIFQWYYNKSPVGSPTSDGNSSTYTLTDVQTNQSGNYYVEVINGDSSANSSNAVLTVVPLPPIVITTQPVSITNIVGSNATFMVAASGVGLNYQWQHDSTNLVDDGTFTGTTMNLLSITGVTSNEAGIYSVMITNVNGIVTSSNATLTVVYPPTISAQPTGGRLVLGSTASFNVAASGFGLNYQWLFNGNSVPNATNSNYTVYMIGTNNSGYYSVAVTNLAGSLMSSNAWLTVLIPPDLGFQLAADYPLLALNGMLSNNYVVQYSTNLSGTNWINLLSLTNLSSSPYEFIDPAGVVQPARYYRVLMQ